MCFVQTDRTVSLTGGKQESRLFVSIANDFSPVSRTTDFKIGVSAWIVLLVSAILCIVGWISHPRTVHGLEFLQPKTVNIDDDWVDAELRRKFSQQLTVELLLEAR